MPDYSKSDYIEQHREDAIKAGLEWFQSEDDDDSVDEEKKNGRIISYI